MAFDPSKVDDVSFDQFTGRTAESMKFIAEQGISNASLQTLKRVGYSLIRTAKKRIRELETAGYTDVPAYRYYKNNIKNFSMSKTNLNQARHILMETYKFLLSKTSTVEGAETFLNSTIEKWVGQATTREQRERIFDLYHRLEAIHPSFFTREAYSSSELAADIYTISEVLRSKDWVIEEAMAILEHEEGTSLIFDDDIDEDLMDELGMWFDRHS